MTNRRYIDPQFDLFLPYVSELPIRDQRETMERPFFSLAKRKRTKPIEYVSPNREIFVNVYPNPEFGMATIWDADILIWAASSLHDMRRKGINDLPRTLNFQPYDLLKTINRPTGGRDYKLLRNALGRLQSTTIQTNIRARRGKKLRQFSWIESYTDLIDETTEESRGMSVTLADWFYEGVLMEGGVLSIDSVYFTISGGRERWLYRVARKHAGGAGTEGFAISLRTLFQKSGAEGNFRRFKYEIQKIANRDDLPQYRLILEDGQNDVILRMIRRDAVGAHEPTSTTSSDRSRRARQAPSHDRHSQSSDLPLFNHLDDNTIERIRRDFPGWDIYALKAEFDAWLADNPERRPRDYNSAFYGFVRNHDRRNAGP